MCIMLTDHEPSSTRLINIPVVYNNYRYNLLIYTNDLAIENNSTGNKSGFLSRSFEVMPDLQEKKGALMIVPIPNAYNVTNFGLVDVSDNLMKVFRQELFRECDNLKPKMRSLSTNGSYMYSSNSTSLKRVHDIGNYKILIANNLEELKKNINWAEFKIPSDFDSRFATLSNSEIYGSEQYAYVVAQAQKSVKDDGFGVVYPDSGYDYFPTAHESPLVNSNVVSFGDMGNYSSFIDTTPEIGVDYDVKIYNFTKQERSQILFGGKQRQSYNLTNKNLLDLILSKLNLNMTMSDSGDNEEYTVNNEAQVVNFAEINGKALNENLILAH